MDDVITMPTFVLVTIVGGSVLLTAFLFWGSTKDDSADSPWAIATMLIVIAIICSVVAFVLGIGTGFYYGVTR